MLHERLGVSHVRSEVWVGGEHGGVPGRLGALQGKVVGEVQTAFVKSFLVEHG